MTSENLKLIGAYLDGELSDAQADRLSEWLRQDKDHVYCFVVESFLHRQLYDTLCGQRLQKAVEAFEEQYSAYKSPVSSPAQGFFGGSWQRVTNYLSNQVLISLTTATAVIGLLLMVLSFMAAPNYQQSRWNCAYNSSDDGIPTSSPPRQPRDKDGKFKFVARGRPVGNQPRFDQPGAVDDRGVGQANRSHWLSRDYHS